VFPVIQETKIRLGLADQDDDVDQNGINSSKKGDAAPASSSKQTQRRGKNRSDGTAIREGGGDIGIELN
jgi:hypothetical protein